MISQSDSIRKIQLEIRLERKGTGQSAEAKHQSRADVFGHRDILLGEQRSKPGLDAVEQHGLSLFSCGPVKHDPRRYFAESHNNGDDCHGSTKLLSVTVRGYRHPDVNTD